MNARRGQLARLAGLVPAASVAALVLVASPVAAYDPLTWYTVDGGGIVGAVGGTHRLSGSSGQPDAGTLAGGSFVLRGGFWRRVQSPSTTHTYTWNIASGPWSSPSSWTPARNTPSAGDTLVFDGAVTPAATVTDIPPDTFGRLHLKANAAVTIQNDGGVDTLRIAGTAGDDFIIEAGSRLALFATPDSGHSVKIALASGATGRISGELWAAYGPHRVLPADAGSLVFASGANCRAMDGLVGSLFGDAGAADVVRFESGSGYHQDGGSAAFGLAPPASRVVLQPGSLYRHLSVAADDAFNGRTYGDCEISLGNPLDACPAALTFGCRIDNLSIPSGRLQIAANTPDSALDIRGDLIVLPTGALEVDPAGPTVARVRFTGSVVQNVNLMGTLTLGAFSEVEVVNPVAVLLGSDLFTSGSVKLSGGRLLTGEHLLHLGETGTVTGPYWVDGNLGQSLPGSAGTVTRDFRVGDGARAAPVSLSFASVGDTGTVVVRTDAGDHPDLAASALDPDKSVNRRWTLSNLGVSFTTCDATFAFDPDDVDAGADPNLFRVGRRESGSWSLPAIGARAATSTQATALASLGEFAVGEPEGTLAADDAPPTVTALVSARPSPFRTSAALDFTLARRGPIELSIFDVSGRRVRVLEHGQREVGRYRAVWDGRDDGNSAVQAGAYFARLVTPDGNFHRRIIRVR